MHKRSCQCFSRDPELAILVDPQLAILVDPELAILGAIFCHFCVVLFSMCWSVFTVLLCASVYILTCAPVVLCVVSAPHLSLPVIVGFPPFLCAHLFPVVFPICV